MSKYDNQIWLGAEILKKKRQNKYYARISASLLNVTVTAEASY